TTVPSIQARLEPRMVAMRIQRLRAGLRVASAWGARRTRAVSQGERTAVVMAGGETTPRGGRPSPTETPPFFFHDGFAQRAPPRGAPAACSLSLSSPQFGCGADA